MNYSLNPSALGSMFAVPSDVVTKHIKLAGSMQLKVLLVFLKYSSDENVEQTIAKTLNISTDDVRDALYFWAERQVLTDNSAPKELNSNPVVKTEKSAHIVSKPSREDTVKRGAQSKEIQFMFNEVQMKLGRLVTYAEMSTLVWLHDNQGLPVSVILMAVEYAVSEGKTNFGYIEKMCIDWAKNGIYTLESAEKRINEMYMSSTAWRIVESAFGISHRRPSANEEKFSSKWVNEWGFKKDMLSIAYNKCIDNNAKISFAYINKIIESWYKSGIKSPDEINSDVEKTTSKAKSGTSYKISEIKSKINNFD